MSAFVRKLKWLAQWRRKEDELREELQFHLDEEAAEFEAAGLTKHLAKRAARRDLGNITFVQESTRAEWGWTWLEQLAQDLRYARRAMMHDRAFTIVAALTLALGIGANTVIFSFIDAILQRSLPVRQPESLAVLNWHAKTSRGDFVMHSMSGTSYDDPKTGTTAGIFPFPAFELFRRYDAVFSTVFAHFRSWHAKRLNVAIKGRADIASGDYVSGDYFGGLGVAPAAGRLIIPDDDRAGAPAVAVVSHAFSQSRFGGAGNARGQSVLIDNLPFTVVGVTPPEFFGVDPAAAPDVYLPMHTNELLGAGHPFGFRPEAYFDRNYYWVEIMGRLRPGVSLAQAQAALAPPFHQWVASTATNDRERANLPELVVREGGGGLDSLRRQYSKPLYVLLTLVGLILVLACANVANLLLARAAGRRREIALRQGLGANRLRIVRQLLTESVLLAWLGGILGVLFATGGIRFLTLLLANGRANFTVHAELNWHVLGAAAALSFVTGMLFGVAPAMQSTGGDLVSALKETRGRRPGSRRLFRGVGVNHALVTAQIAISALMLVAAGLFVRTLSNLQSIDVGFNRESVLLFQVDARKAGHKEAEIAVFYGDLLKRLRAIPGVREASLSSESLIGAGSGLPVSVRGLPPNPANRYLTVGPDFFKTMQIPILAGRDIGDRDGPGSPAVAVINEVFARANFGERNPLGQRLILREAGEGDWIGRDMEIVGVSRNARNGSLKRAIPPVVYFPFNQGYPQPNEIVYALRTAGDPLRYVNSIREVVRQADARVPVSEIRTQAADIDHTINQEITFADLCTGFAILALAIACVGLYGTMSYNTARRTGEIGIRMALGAQRGSVIRMILREAFALAATGLAIGMVLALCLSRFVASFLFGMKANDPTALCAAAITLGSAAVLAAYVPAWKASRIDPTVALRHE